MTTAQTPAPRSPEAVDHAASALLGTLVRNLIGGGSGLYWLALLNIWGEQDALTLEMGLDKLAREGLVEYRVETPKLKVVLGAGLLGAIRG